MRYFLYARKSTDVEDKQVMSIEGQLAELRALAKSEGLEIAAEFIEKQSAKMPGRPVFSEMLEWIQNGEVQGIVCWKLDRLARNPVDGEQISWLLQENIIRHIRTHDRSHLPGDNVLMMSVEFGMANQFIRDLSSNVKRGLRLKVKRGEYPGLAPIGYLNDPREKSVVIDRKKARLVRQAFEMYAGGSKRLEDIAHFFAEHGIISKGNKRVHVSRVSFILSNPFYCGLFRYAGELYEGKHQPIVTKKLFDEVQKVLRERGRRLDIKNDPSPYCGLLHCGSCNMMITAENKVKRQKNGNVHYYTYYRCTKKSKTIKCPELHIRQEELDRQLSALLVQSAMPKAWAESLLAKLDGEEQWAVQTAATSATAMREDMRGISSRLERLTDLYIAQDIERDDYLQRRRALVLERKTFEEQIARLEHNAAAWVEPMREWITTASNLDKIAKGIDLPSKKSSLQNIFGSNLQLYAREARGTYVNQWLSLSRAKESPTQNDTTLIMEATAGFAPAHTSFAEKRLTTWLRGRNYTVPSV